MTEDADNIPNETPGPEEVDSLLGGFDFTPDWARGTPGVQSQPVRERDERRGGGERRGPRAPDSARRGLQGVRVKPRRDDSRPPRDEGDSRDFRSRDDRGPRRGPPPPRLPVHIDFIPEKNRLSKVVKIIRQTHRAFPMDQIAHKFMEDPAFLSVKFTVKEKGPDVENLHLFQCTANGMVFSSNEACVQYILDRGLGEYYDSEEKEVPPPNGNFICVGRHRGSGKWVGPPNWHGYQRRIEELRSELAPGMSPEEFARQIETVHEAEAIEAWKSSVSKQVFYRRKPAAATASASEEQTAEEPAAEDPAEEPAERPAERPAEEIAETPLADAPEVSGEAEPPADFTLTREQAEKEFLESVVPTLMTQSRRAIMPGYLVPHMTDPILVSMVQHHLRREHDRPGSIVFALRPAFKHMRLHLFRHDGELMITGVPPHPLPADQKIAAELRRILDHVAEHPRCAAKECLQVLTEGGGEPAPELVSHMHWLIEKGHLIEFSDGTLAIPHSRASHD